MKSTGVFTRLILKKKRNMFLIVLDFQIDNYKYYFIVYFDSNTKDWA